MAKKLNIMFPFQDSVKGFFLESTEVTTDQVKSDLLHLLFTRKRQRYYMPDFGTDLMTLIFEPNDDISSNELIDMINNDVSKYLPFVTITSITVDNLADEYTKSVKINFSIKDNTLRYNDTLEVLI